MSKKHAKAFKFPLEILPTDLQVAIIGHLPWRSLILAGSVSKNWYLFCSSNSIWENHFLQEFVYRNRQIPNPQQKQQSEEHDLGIYSQHKEAWKETTSDKTSYWKDICRGFFNTKGTVWVPSDRPDKERVAELLAASQNPMYKLVVMGGGKVGKSAAVVRFIQDMFVEEYDPTIEDAYRCSRTVCKTTLVFDLLDTAGQEEYAMMRDSYLRSGEGFLVCYSTIDRKSFVAVGDLISQLLEVKKTDKWPMVLCGLQCDLWTKRQVSQEEGIATAKRYNIPFVESSAFTRINKDEMFLIATHEVVLYDGHPVIPKETPPTDESKEKTKCCVQ